MEPFDCQKEKMERKIASLGKTHESILSRKASFGRLGWEGGLGVLQVDA